VHGLRQTDNHVDDDKAKKDRDKDIFPDVQHPTCDQHQEGSVYEPLKSIHA
jgi:hypothetical protein